MSALPPGSGQKGWRLSDVHFVPKGDIRIAANFLIRSPRRRGRAVWPEFRGRVVTMRTVLARRSTRTC